MAGKVYHPISETMFVHQLMYCQPCRQNFEIPLRKNLLKFWKGFLLIFKQCDQVWLELGEPLKETPNSLTDYLENVWCQKYNVTETTLQKSYSNYSRKKLKITRKMSGDKSTTMQGFKERITKQADSFCSFNAPEEGNLYVSFENITLFCKRKSYNSYH